MLNSYIVFQKIGDIEMYEGEIYSIIQVYDRVFEKIPMISQLENIRILPLTNPPGVDGWPESLNDYIPSFEVSLKTVMIRWSKNRYPQNHLTFIGNKTVSEIEYTYRMVSELDWEKDKMEDWLCDCYLRWQGVEY